MIKSSCSESCVHQLVRGPDTCGDIYKPASFQWACCFGNPRRPNQQNKIDANPVRRFGALWFGGPRGKAGSFSESDRTNWSQFHGYMPTVGTGHFPRKFVSPRILLQWKRRARCLKYWAGIFPSSMICLYCLWQSLTQGGCITAFPLQRGRTTWISTRLMHTTARVRECASSR